MPEETQDLYEILQVHHAADAEVIEVAYKRLLRLYHPDVNKSPGAHAVTVRLNKAYETLSDPVKRRKYDCIRVQEYNYATHNGKMKTFRDVVSEIDEWSNNSSEKGKLFEGLIKGFLKNDVEYSKRFRSIWLWTEYPRRNNRPDTGVDIVAKDSRGHYVAIQCKYRSNPESRLSRNDMSEFLAELGTRDYDEGIVFSTVDGLSKNADDNLKRSDKKVVHVGFKDLESSSIDWTSFDVRSPANLRRKEEWVAPGRFHQERESTNQASNHTSSRKPTTPPYRQHFGNWQPQTQQATPSFIQSLKDIPFLIEWQPIIVVTLAAILAAALVIAGIVFIGPFVAGFVDAFVTALVTGIMFLLRVAAIMVLIAIFLGALYAAIRYEPELGLVAGIALCICAGVLLTHSGAKAFLIHYLSEDYAAYMFLGGIVVAFIAGFRKFGDRY